MKKLILHILVVFLSGSSCAKKEMISGIEKKEVQRRYQESRDKLRPFPGTWMGIENGDTLIVELRIDSTYSDLFGIYISSIQGTYTYSGFSDQGKYDQDSLTQPITVGVVRLNDESNSLSALFRDPVYNNNAYLRLSPDSAYQKLSWKLTFRERFFFAKKWEGPTQFDLLLEKEYQNYLKAGKIKGSPVRLDTIPWLQKYASDDSLNQRIINPTDPPETVIDDRNREIERWNKFSVPTELILKRVD